jgi:bacteriorhodopsin
MSGIVNSATKLSLAIQTITGVFGLYGLTIPVAPKDIILKQVLGLEMIVQVIEFIFYLGFLSVFNLGDLTRKRYYDWFLSTPVMLFTISLYFYYVNFVDGNSDANIADFTSKNAKEIMGFVVLNALMLLFGFLAEIGIMNRGLAFVLGMGALIGSFGIIYKSYAQFSETTRNIFWIMFGLWAMYGLAFLMQPVAKNVGYTALDIFAKNFFGIFLYYIIAQKRVVAPKGSYVNPDNGDI